MRQVSYIPARQLGSSLGTSVIGIVLAIGFAHGLLSGTPSPRPPDQAQLSILISDATINPGMEWAFVAMILVVISVFIAGLFIGKTGKIV
jgi:hypothetical protein